MSRMRKTWMWWAYRAGEPYRNMQYAFNGHIVVLCDEFTASDGEAFCDGFRRLGLGTTIGMRTWGGEIWLNSSNRLTDNGLARAPMMGVYADGEWSWDPNNKPPYYKGIEGLYVQNLSSSESDHMMISLLMEYGGHHTDLMFSKSTHDPPDIKAAREIEREYIQRWIDQFWEDH